MQTSIMMKMINLEELERLYNMRKFKKLNKIIIDNLYDIFNELFNLQR